MERADLPPVPRAPKITRRDVLIGLGGALTAGVGYYAVRKLGVPISLDALSAASSVKSSQPKAEASLVESELPQDLRSALHKEFGDYERLVTWDEMIAGAGIGDKNIIAIGETHTDTRDIKTAGQIINSVRNEARAKGIGVALAVERFSVDLNTELNSVWGAVSIGEKEMILRVIFNRPEYRNVWNATANPNLSSVAAGPSPLTTKEDQEAFESLMIGCAKGGIYIFGIDVPYNVRSDLSQMMDPVRNEFWTSVIRQFYQANRNEKVVLLVVGGDRHMGGAADSLPSQCKGLKLGGVVSIGQRQINSSTGIETIEQLAKSNGIKSIIARKPERAAPIFKEDGTIVSSFSPGDYWIAVDDTEYRADRLSPKATA